MAGGTAAAKGHCGRAVVFGNYDMHPLIVRAEEIVSSWDSDEPRALALAAAALCKTTLDAGGLPTDSPDWIRLREAFDVQTGQSIAESIVKWDDLCRFADVDLTNNRDAYVKMGIVTWTVKLLLKRFGMLVHSEAITDFAEWKRRLCHCLGNYIIV